LQSGFVWDGEEKGTKKIFLEFVENQGFLLDKRMFGFYYW